MVWVEKENKLKFLQPKGWTTAEVLNNIEITSSWNTTEQNWKIGVSRCPPRTLFKMNLRYGRSPPPLPPQLFQQSRNIILWNWKKTRMNVCGMVPVILLIEQEANW